MHIERADQPPLCLAPRPLARTPARPLPHGTVDCHFHVFSEHAPLNVPRSYTPQIVTLSAWLEFAQAVGIAKGLVVQPSVYGLDNSVLLSGLAAAPERLRGIVVVPPDLPGPLLTGLDRAGVRGVRVNVRNKGGLPLSAAALLRARVEHLGWSVQMQIRPEHLPDIGAMMSTNATPVVIDHLGFIALEEPEAESHFSALQRLLDRPGVYVKLSAPYRLARDRGVFVAAAAGLVASHPEKLLWGSDWPHTELFETMPDDAELIDTISMVFGGDDRVRRMVFADTAERLFFSR